MTAPADITAAMRHSIDVLTDIDDPRTTLIAAALDKWLAGADLEATLGLIPGWRSHLRRTASNRALAALVKIHANLDDSALADWIVEGCKRMDTRGNRPDGPAGHLSDLVYAGCILSKRQWRRLIRGHRASAWPS